MMSRVALLLGAVALVLTTGCTTGGFSAAGPAYNAGGAAAPAPVYPLDCRNRGVYNRAANLCVSEGA